MFEVFSKTHIFVLILTLILSLILFNLKDKFFDQIRIFIGSSLLLHQLVFFIWHFWHQTFSIERHLPLHLCSFSSFLIPLALFTKNLKIIKIVIFWSPVSAFLALLFPDLHASSIFSFDFLEFFFSHIFIWLGCVFIYSSQKIRLNILFKDLVESSLLILITSLFLVYPINLVLKSNYMYLITAPKITNLKIFPDYPLHLFYMFNILILVFLLEFYFYKLFFKTK